MKYEFHHHSARARKSRFFVNFSKGVRTAMVLVATLLVLGGLGMWVTDNPIIGSILMSTAVAMALPLVWYAYDIAHLERTDAKGASVRLEDVLSPDVVGRLHNADSPQSLWKGVQGTWQQRFFSTRYGVAPDYISQVASTGEQTGTVLDDALELSKRHGEVGISTASILVALIKTLPNHQEVLGERGLDIEELESSIDWIHHTEDVIANQGKTKHFGGLARDWTSGYTPTLNQMAHNMTFDVEAGGYSHRDLGAHSQTIDEMVKFMCTGRQNTLLVGDVGVGKTITAYGFAQKILTDEKTPKSIRYDQVFSLNASSIITSSDDPNKVESTVLSIIAEAQKAKNTILFFDDAASFFAEGTGTINLSKVLLPIIENGAIPAIFAMTPIEWQNISASNQALAGMLNFLAVPESDRESTLRVLEDQSLMIESKFGVTITYRALTEAIDLSDRYINDIAYPGKAISALENAVNHAEGGLVTERSVQQSIEVTQGVKVQVASGAEKEELLNLEVEIHKRMINQTRAVKVISDALRRARSGVNNPDKPIGTFMFLGPTGVGKTELAKAVAGVYFGNESNMVRVDMNEFTQSSDISRLLDVSSQSSLLSAVGRNRFTVVLFDEIEKAHPEVVNVFLQLLDEGVMRDANNKEVSFKDTIVIATSNAGADSIRAYIDAGKDVKDFESDFISSLIDGQIFKPEFLNRFDETVVFRPLKPEELLQVVDLLIAEVNKNLNKKKVAVELTPEAKVWLVEQGYDPRLGARPLRRMVQRTVENVVAKKVLQSDFTPGTTLTLDKPDLVAEAGEE